MLKTPSLNNCHNRRILYSAGQRLEPRISGKFATYNDVCIFCNASGIRIIVLFQNWRHSKKIGLPICHSGLWSRGLFIQGSQTFDFLVISCIHGGYSMEIGDLLIYLFSPDHRFQNFNLKCMNVLSKIAK